jgi:2-desacetyl-2-hydroxyethyl bacteriochlorophyllide A dehydrogenase
MKNSHSSAQDSAEQLWFTAPLQVALRTAPLPLPGPGELQVRTQLSAVSAGTEMLVYRGQIPADMSLDATLSALQGTPGYPLQYGYACVGRVERVGPQVDEAWLGRRVFSFAPHASRFLARTTDVIVVPDDVPAEAAVFLANMETAVNLLQDGNPALGERIVVLGQGIVGLLLDSLLVQCPLQSLHGVDALEARRARALHLGVDDVFDPLDADDIEALRVSLREGGSVPGADLIYEVTGVPEALNLAIDLSGYTSRIVIGSWYGSKSAAIALGGEAHRNRLRISTSQVSTLAPELSGRWTKERRFALCWDMLRRTMPQALISHRMPFSEAATLYTLLHESPGQVMQAVFVYD